MKEVFWEKVDKIDGRVLEDGERIVLETLSAQDIIFPLGCCDCGLVHSMVLSWDNDTENLSITFFRDDGMTTRARAYFKQFFNTPEAVRCINEQEARISERLMR